MNLQITPGGLRALAAGGGETQSVRITRIALGSGRGPGGASDADRAALRTPRDAVVVVAGEPSNAARLTVSAAISPTGAAYSVSEVGVFARPVDGAGPVGDELLFAFWTHPTDTLAAAAPGVDVVVYVTVDIRGGAGVTVDLSPAIAFRAPQTFADLADTLPVGAEHLLGVGDVGGAVGGLDASAVAAMLLAAAPPRMLTFVADGSIVAPADRVWLVVAFGAGGAGAGRYDVASLRWQAVRGAAGGDTTFSAPPQVRAAGGAGGVQPPALPGRRPGSLGDIVVAGAGCAGGQGSDGDGYSGLLAGMSGDLAISLFTPVAGRRYDVVVGAGGADRGHASRPTGGESGQVMVLEFSG